MKYPPLWSAEVEKRVRQSSHSIDEQATPTEVKFCTKCVISNQRPRIEFDDEGVCSACRFAERKKSDIDWEARERELRNVLGAKRQHKGYDVLVPGSGGKDSSYVAHSLKMQGMTPLCVTWAPFMYTDVGRENMGDFVHSGFDVMTMTPNGLIHRKLARLSLEYVGDPFLPFIWGQLAYPMHIALKHNIPLVFYGENGEAEYGGDPSANDKPCWEWGDWERIYQKGTGAGRIIKIGLEKGAFTDKEAESASEFYTIPDRRVMEAAGVEFHWLSYYRRWHPQSNFYDACENTGFKPNNERSEGTYSKYASIDDKLDGLHYWLSYKKFGLGRCSSDAAHEVRDEDITREEAVALVKRYDGESPKRHLMECLDYLGTDVDHMATIGHRFSPAHLWKEDGDDYILKHTVFEC